jgi:hypothetical protein
VQQQHHRCVGIRMDMSSDKELPSTADQHDLTGRKPRRRRIRLVGSPALLNAVRLLKVARVKHSVLL